MILLPPKSKLPPVTLMELPPNVIVGPPTVLAMELIPVKSLANFTSIVVSSPVCAMIVLMFVPLYSVSALVPSPFTVTLEPSLLVFSPPELASNFKPLPMIASDVFLRSFTFTAAFGVSLAAVSSLFKNVSPVDVPVLSIAEPTLFTMELPPVVLPAASWKDTITSLAGTSLPVEPSRFVVYVPSGRLTTLVPSALV